MQENVFVHFSSIPSGAGIVTTVLVRWTNAESHCSFTSVFGCFTSLWEALVGKKTHSNMYCMHLSSEKSGVYYLKTSRVLLTGAKVFLLLEAEHTDVLCVISDRRICLGVSGKGIGSDDTIFIQARD